MTSCESQRSECSVLVRAAPGTLSIVPAGGSMATGQVVPLAALWQLAGGETRAVHGALWESDDGEMLRVTSDGDLTAIRPGSSRIRVRRGGRVGESTYQVTRVDVASVRILPRLWALGAGEEVRLQAQATDRLGSSRTGRVVTWVSSCPEVAVVEPDGTLRGTGPGTARISASIGAGLANFEVKISPVALAALRIEPGALVLRAGESAPLKAVVQGVRGGVLPGFPIDWVSSDPGIATVDGSGVVTGQRFGSARIVASAGGRRATVAVEVRMSPVLTSGVRQRGGP